jgi:hypothetical protein
MAEIHLDADLRLASSATLAQTSIDWLTYRTGTRTFSR